MRLTLDARARAWLRRLPSFTPYSAAELVLLLLLAVQAARLVWAVVTPVGPLGDWRPVMAGVPGSPAAVLTGFDPFFRLSAPADGGAQTVTPLQLTLFGIRIDEAQGGGGAIIAGPDGVQQSIGVGQGIQPGVVLKAVAFDHVTITRGGADEQLFIAQGDSGAGAAPVPVAPAGPSLLGGSSAAAAPGGGLTVERLRAGVGAIPRIDGGRVTGLTVRAEGDGQVFRSTGLQEGDVITAIAGRPITGPGDLQALGSQLSSGGQVAVTVERGGRAVPLSIAVTPNGLPR